MVSCVCPNCGTKFKPEKKRGFTTLRVSRDFIEKLEKEQTDPTFEAVLRRKLGWEPLVE